MTTLVTRIDRPERPATLDAQGSTMLLMNEALARSRQHDAERAAYEHRLARSLSAGRSWARLARYCARRAERARAAAG
ncbi:hypothetical protein [Pseudonocardia xishanensis]|uniref:Uncharacterized protein n=1 Tax=Pseudonocardia xishanensis TaxID=630995 RepID=A0ABP8S4Y2_9PSEU